MKECLDHPVFIFVAIAVMMLTFGFGFAIAYFLRDKITGVSLSRFGFDIHTNDVPVWSRIVDVIDFVDSNTRKAIRKATLLLVIIDPDKYNLSTDVILVNLQANQPLIYAAYENHHTREIASDGGDVYLTDKTNDIIEAVKRWKKHFPELTDERSEALTCYWFKKVVAPIVRKACLEKVDFYNSQIKRTDVSKALKEILVRCRDKNVDYIQRIDELSGRSDITEKSTVFIKGQIL